MRSFLAFFVVLTFSGCVSQDKDSKSTSAQSSAVSRSIASNELLCYSDDNQSRVIARIASSKASWAKKGWSKAKLTWYDGSSTPVSVRQEHGLTVVVKVNNGFLGKKQGLHIFHSGSSSVYGDDDFLPKGVSNRFVCDHYESGKWPEWDGIQ